LIEGEAEPDEDIITRFRAAGIEIKKLKDKKESLERSINSTAAPKLTKIPANVISFNETREEANLRLKDEIRKRVARIQITFNLEMLVPPELDRKIYGIRSGKGQIGLRVTFVNGAERRAIIDGLKASLLWLA
jgi:hypothetical protein